MHIITKYLYLTRYVYIVWFLYLYHKGLPCYQDIIGWQMGEGEYFKPWMHAWRNHPWTFKAIVLPVIHINTLLNNNYMTIIIHIYCPCLLIHHIHSGGWNDLTLHTQRKFDLLYWTWMKIKTWKLLTHSIARSTWILTVAIPFLFPQALTLRVGTFPLNIPLQHANSLSEIDPAYNLDTKGMIPDGEIPINTS